MISVLEGEDINTPKHVDVRLICHNVVFCALGFTCSIMTTA